MSRDPQQTSPIFTQIDITAGGRGELPRIEHDGEEQTELLHQILASLDRHNELLEELVANAGAAQRQRHGELNQWREANPELSERCREAAQALARVQAEFLHQMTMEIEDSAEDMVDGEYVFNEFVDRFGPRMAHLNGILQMLSQLGAVPEPAAVEE